MSDSLKSYYNALLAVARANHPTYREAQRDLELGLMARLGGLYRF